MSGTDICDGKLPVICCWLTEIDVTAYIVLLCVSAYDGPYENSPESPESHMTKIKVTPDSTKTEETDSDNDIPTIPTGYCWAVLCVDMAAYFKYTVSQKNVPPST